MNNHTTNCPCCNTALATVTAAQIIQFGARWACPVCGHIMDYAAKQAARPGISKESKEAWTAVAGFALFIGLLMFVDRVTT